MLCNPPARGPILPSKRAGSLILKGKPNMPGHFFSKKALINAVDVKTVLNENTFSKGESLPDSRIDSIIHPYLGKLVFIAASSNLGCADMLSA